MNERDETQMELTDCLYIIPSVDKPIKIVFEGTPIEDNGGMTLDELLNTRFGIFEVTDE